MSKLNIDQKSIKELLDLRVAHGTHENKRTCVCTAWFTPLRYTGNFCLQRTEANGI